MLTTRILPMSADVPLIAVTLSGIKTWRSSLDPGTPSNNAGAYRLLSAALQSAADEELSTASHRRSAEPVPPG